MLYWATGEAPTKVKEWITCENMLQNKDKQLTADVKKKQLEILKMKSIIIEVNSNGIHSK